MLRTTAWTTSAPSSPSQLCSFLELGGSSRPSAQAPRTLCFYKGMGWGRRRNRHYLFFYLCHTGCRSLLNFGGDGTPPPHPLDKAAETSPGNLQAGAIQPGTEPAGPPPTSWALVTGQREGGLLGNHSGPDSSTVVCTGPPVPITGLEAPVLLRAGGHGELWLLGANKAV